ncbi:MAG: IMPACT family protein, partial [Christensenellales bacterium]
YVLNGVEKCSDDGEPSGTAGKPILNVIQKNKLTNVLIVCVRYFGGIKLGAGPLTRAYSQSAVLALKSAKTKELKAMLEISFHIAFDKAFKVYVLSGSGLFSLLSRVGNDFVVVCTPFNKEKVVDMLSMLEVSNLFIKEVLL